MFESQKMTLNVEKIVAHVCSWLVLLLLPQIFFTVPLSFMTFMFEIVIIIPVVVVFYSHAHFSLPYFFCRKKYVYYSLSLIFLAFFFVLTVRLAEPIRYWYIEQMHQDSSVILCPQLHIHSSHLMPPAEWVSFLLTIIASAIYSISLRNVQRERRLRELEKQQAVSNLQLLKWQLSPHFLFNVLNTVYSLSLKKSDDLPKVVLTVSDLLRYITYDSEKNEVSAEKEIAYLNDYIKLQKLRLASESNVEFVVENNNPEAKIAPMLLIPFFENAFKHGVNTDGVVSISSSIIVSKTDVFFRIINSKHSKNNWDEVHGVGFENVKTRLNLLYGSKHSLEIFNTDTEYEVVLKLKL